VDEVLTTAYNVPNPVSVVTASVAVVDPVPVPDGDERVGTAVELLVTLVPVNDTIAFGGLAESVTLPGV
jgi:hypothetical protein